MLRFSVKVRDSVTSGGTRMLSILVGPESLFVAQGMSVVSSSIENVLFTARIESFELTLRPTSVSVNRSSGKVMLMFCIDPWSR